jgi:hypothetical protein
MHCREVSTSIVGSSPSHAVNVTAATATSIPSILFTEFFISNLLPLVSRQGLPIPASVNLLFVVVHRAPHGQLIAQDGDPRTWVSAAGAS